MRATLARGDLHRALASAGRAVERRQTIPILSHLLVRAEAGRLRLTGTDLDMAVTATVPAEVSEPGALTLPAAPLVDWVRKTAEGPIAIEGKGDGQATLKQGRARINLSALAADDFPTLEAGDTPHGFTLPGRDLAALLESVAFAISTEETRYYLNGIFLHVVDVDGVPELRAVATDGHRLGRASRPVPNGAGSMPGIIVPRKTVAEIVKLAEAAGERDVAVDLSAAKIAVADGIDDAPSLRLVSKLIDGTFPDYARVIPIGNDKVATLDAKPFAAALDRVGAIASERGRAVKLDFGDDAVTLAVTNTDLGRADEEVPCGYAADPLAIGFNARYAADILGALAATTVEVAMANPGAPTTWRDPTRPDRLYVLMPMRV